MKTRVMIIAMLLSVLSVEVSFAGEVAGEVVRYNSQSDSIMYFHPFCANDSDQNHPVALKTNLLYWTVAIPNLSAEFYLSARLSLSAEIAFAWWGNRSESFCWQIFTASPELRYWFSEKRTFGGHYMGVYAGGGLYDVMLKPLTGNKGYQGKYYATAGLSYGYVFPIGKGLSLELGLGIGYLVTQYDEYVRGCSDFMRTDTKRTTWIGPTKINLMLVWQIPR